MPEDSAARERALRTLPLPYSLALRRRGRSRTRFEYLDVEVAALAGLYRIAEAKLAAADQQIAGPQNVGSDPAKL